jgi:hypothetical protein
MISNSRRERPGLREHLVADADLADVIGRRAEAEDLDVGFAERICRPTITDNADPLGVAGRVRVARVERCRQSLDRGDVGRLGRLFGRDERRHQLVERVRERGELLARAPRRQALREVVRGRHGFQLLRQIVDGTRDGLREPEADDGAKAERAERDDEEGCGRGA